MYIYVILPHGALFFRQLMALVRLCRFWTPGIARSSVQRSPGETRSWKRNCRRQVVGFKRGWEIPEMEVCSWEIQLYMYIYIMYILYKCMCIYIYKLWIFQQAMFDFTAIGNGK